MMERLLFKAHRCPAYFWPCMLLLVHSFVCPLASADEATDQWVTDFNISLASASSDGKYLLAIGRSVGEKDENPSMMVLFDLDRRRQLKAVKAERPAYIGIDNERIFVVPQDRKTLKVLELRTFKEQSSIQVEEKILDMTLVSQRRVGLLLQKRHANAVVFFDRETLERDTRQEENETFSGVLDAFPYNDSWYRTRTELRNRNTDEHVCVVEAPLIAKFSSRKNPAPYPFPESRSGVAMLRNSLPHRGAVMGRADGISWGQAKPFENSMELWNWRWDRNGKDEFILNRAPEEVWVVSRLAEANLNSYFQFLVFRKSDVVFISNQVLTFIPRNPAGGNNTLRFKREPVAVLETNVSAKIQLNCKGGTGKKLWASESKSPHVWLDESTGMLSVDTPAIWAEHLAVASDPESRYQTFDPKRSAAEFHRITGKAVPKGKTAFYIPIEFRVEDAKLQRVEASLFLLVLAPTADYEVAKSVAPVTKGITNLVGDAIDAINQLDAAVDAAKKDPGLMTLDERIVGAQKKANEIQSQLERIESLVKEIRSLERGDK